MNIEKERMAFEGYVLSLSKYKKRSPKFIFDLDENGDYDNQDIYELHHAWQASANRKGFVLVPKEPSNAMLKASWDNLDAGGSDEFWSVFREVLKAQEQSNESN